jgi:hypothetical protein
MTRLRIIRNIISWLTSTCTVGTRSGTMRTRGQWTSLATSKQYWQGPSWMSSSPFCWSNDVMHQCIYVQYRLFLMMIHIRPSMTFLEADNDFRLLRVNTWTWAEPEFFLCSLRVLSLPIVRPHARGYRWTMPIKKSDFLSGRYKFSLQVTS